VKRCERVEKDKGQFVMNRWLFVGKNPSSYLAFIDYEKNLSSGIAVG